MVELSRVFHGFINKNTSSQSNTIQCVQLVGGKKSIITAYSFVYLELILQPRKDEPVSLCFEPVYLIRMLKFHEGALEAFISALH